MPDTVLTAQRPAVLPRIGVEFAQHGMKRLLPFSLRHMRVGFQQVDVHVAVTEVTKADTFQPMAAAQAVGFRQQGRNSGGRDDNILAAFSPQ